MPLSLTQIVPFDEAAMPHGLTRFAIGVLRDAGDVGL